MLLLVVKAKFSDCCFVFRHFTNVKKAPFAIDKFLFRLFMVQYFLTAIRQSLPAHTHTQTQFCRFSTPYTFILMYCIYINVNSAFIAFYQVIVCKGFIVAVTVVEFPLNSFLDRSFSALFILILCNHILQQIICGSISACFIQNI